MSDGYEITEPIESPKEQADASNSSREVEKNEEFSRGVDQTALDPESVIEQEGDYKQAEEVVTELTDIVRASDSKADSPGDDSAADRSESNVNETDLAKDASDQNPSETSDEIETVIEVSTPEVLVPSEPLDSAADEDDKKVEESAPARTKEDQAESMTSDVSTSTEDSLEEKSPGSEDDVETAFDAGIERSDIIENFQETQRAHGKIVAQAWTDNEFKEILIADPKRVLTENGLFVPDEMEVKVLEDTDDRVHLIIPSKPPAQISEEGIGRPSVFNTSLLGITSDFSEQLSDGDMGEDFLTGTGAFQSGHPVEEGQIGDRIIDNSNQVEELDQTAIQETRFDDTITEAQRNYSKIVAQAWVDEDFKSVLLSDPKSALAEQGFNISEQVEVLVFENTDTVGHLLIPREPSELSSDKLMGNTSLGLWNLSASYLNEL